MGAGKMNRKQRKELGRRLQSANPGLEVVHPRAAGIDVGNGAHYVAVRPEQDAEPVRRFECFTADLHRMADWLEACEVEPVAMQSTGVYWIPLYEILEQRGFEVYLVNARHTKNLPGRKSRRAREPMAVRASHPWPAQQLVPAYGGNPGGADVLAATGRTCARCVDLH